MKSRLTLIMALLLFVVLFTLQNTDVVNIQFFIWSFELSRALMIFLVFTVGILIGLFLGSYQRHKENRTMPPPYHDQPKEPGHDQHDSV